jgi:hypothetical protein
VDGQMQTTFLERWSNTIGFRKIGSVFWNNSLHFY